MENSTSWNMPNVDLCRNSLALNINSKYENAKY